LPPFNIKTETKKQRTTICTTPNCKQKISQHAEFFIYAKHKTI